MKFCQKTVLIDLQEGSNLLTSTPSASMISFAFSSTILGFLRACDDFTTKARDFSESLKARKEVIAELQKNKDYEVRITFYIRAGDNQIGYALDAETMNNLSELKLNYNFNLLLWGKEDDV